MEKPKMPHPGHEKHLCYLTNLHFHQTDWDAYKKLVENPKYVCKLCGRACNDPNRVCQAIKLDE